MDRPNLLIWAVLPFLAIAIATGCSVSELPPRVALSGYVTFAGKPIKEGAIMFHPPIHEKGLGCTVLIKDGYYSVGNDLGPMAGPCEVRIAEFERKSVGPSSPEVVVETDRIPDEYNRNTKLQIQIPNRSEVNYSFDLPAVGIASLN
jgi:hypothetical protein